ncbi:MAG: hypothetical protein LKF36_01130 [Lactobacillus sp.]|jgi:hypothetical protein|nr:hypothetical protein [Lactobacillus sp.]
MKVLKYLAILCLSSVYFGIVFLFSHVNGAGEFQRTLGPLDYLNFSHAIVLFPAAFGIVRRFRQAHPPKTTNKSYMQQGYELNGKKESFGTIMYGSAWHSHGRDGDLSRWGFNLALYFGVYLLAVPILGVALVATLIRRQRAD